MYRGAPILIAFMWIRYNSSVENLTLLFNPSSGGGRAARLLPEIRAGLESLNFEVDLRISKSADHLREMAAVASRKPEGLLICAGGDGSNRIVIDAMLAEIGEAPLPTLGLIPAGRGNSFLRDLGIASLEDAFAAIAGREKRKVDVARFRSEGRVSHFINCLGLGFISDAGRMAYRMRALGNLSYVLAVLWEILLLRRHRLILEIDGKHMEEDLIFVEVSNSRMTGGTMQIAPAALIDDGMLDLVLLQRMGRISLLRTFPKIYSGTHGVHPAVRFLQAKRIRIDSPVPKLLLPDGDLEFHTPVEIEVLPKRISCFHLPGKKEEPRP